MRQISYAAPARDPERAVWAAVRESGIETLPENGATVMLEPVVELNEVPDRFEARRDAASEAIR